MRVPLRLALLALPLALVLAACTVTFVPGDGGGTPTRPTPTTPERPDVVVRPQPPAALPGAGSILQFEVTPNLIFPGRVMVFRTRFAAAGYVTVSALGPDDRVVVLLRNYPVGPGFQLVPPTSAPAAEQVLAPSPTGGWTLRAQFAETRTRADYDGLRGADAWTAAIAADLRGAARASVVETGFEVLRR